MSRLNLRPGLHATLEELFPEQKLALFRLAGLIELYGGLEVFMRREVLLHAYLEMKTRDEREFTPLRLDRAVWVSEAEKLSVGRQEKQRQLAEISKQLEELAVPVPE